MKRKLFIVLLAIITMLSCAFGLTACIEWVYPEGEQGSENEAKWGEVYTVPAAYEMATDLGYTGTLEEFIATISGKDGEDGEDGQDGVGIKSVKINDDGELVITFTDDTETNLGKPACEHNFSDFVVGLEATCTSIGYEKRDCSICGFIEYNFTEATGHDWDEGVAVDGTSLTLYTCQTCNETKVNINPKEDDPEQGEEKIPTEGLAYSEIKTNGVVAAYSVSGIGSVTDTDIIIPSTYNGKPVIDIGSNAFCDSFLTSVIIPDSVLTINEWAFLHSTDLSSVTIGNGVEIIGAGAFSECYSLASVIIPDSVTSIGGAAFAAGALVSVNIPYSVNSIGDAAFSGSHLESITVDENSTTYSSYDGILYNKAKTEFIQIPAAIKGDVTIPDSVVASIPDSAFNWNTNVTSITIGNGVTGIGSYAFYLCSNLTSVVIGYNVLSIGSSAFYGCSELASISVLGGNNYYYSDGNCLIERASKKIIVGCKNSVIPTDGSVTAIGSEAFYNCGLTGELIIPDSVTSIGSYAFRDCTDLTSVKLGNGLTSVGYAMFSGCSGLISVTIPSTVTSIDERAFYECSSLTNVIIPDSVTSIGSYAFYKCSSLTGIAIPDNVTYIGWGAFAYCSSLTSVTFANTDGWWYSSKSAATSGTSISSDNLLDASTAATYLVSTYYSYYWHRG